MAKSGAGNSRCTDVATVAGMAIGGWMSGGIFDLSGSYRAAFLNGMAWNRSIWQSPSGSSSAACFLEGVPRLTTRNDHAWIFRLRQLLRHSPALSYKTDLISMNGKQPVLSRSEL